MTAADRQKHAAKNQSLYRSVNERIEELNVAFGQVLDLGEWVCECADGTCSRLIELTVAEYEAVRERPDTFAVAPGHIDPLVERVVEETDRYVVVQKIEAGAEFARENDPRRQRTGSEQE